MKGRWSLSVLGGGKKKKKGGSLLLENGGAEKSCRKRASTSYISSSEREREEGRTDFLSPWQEARKGIRKRKAARLLARGKKGGGKSVIRNT